MNFKKNKTIFYKKHITSISLLVGLIGCIFFPILYHVAMFPVPDYLIHTELMQGMFESKTIMIPHFLYHILVYGIYVLSGINFKISSLIVSFFSYLLLSFVLYRLFYVALKPQKLYQKNTIPFILFFTLSMMLVTPVTILNWLNGGLYSGYVGINVYHNPTIIILKPLALILFICITKIYHSPENNDRYNIIIIAIFIILSTLAKPSYLICLLPASIILAIYRQIKDLPVNWSMMILGSIIPATIVLGWQYYITYSSQQMMVEQSTIIFAPLQVIQMQSSGIMPKFLLSIPFPLYIYSAYFEHAKKDISLNLAWLVFAFGCFYKYFLAESGERMIAGNFGWSAQITLFILFVISMLFFIRHTSILEKLHNWRQIKMTMWGGIMIYSLHLISGIGWYFFCLISVRGY